MIIDTDKNDLEIVDAINLISKKISEVVMMNNQFAGSIMMVDGDQVEEILEESKNLLRANRLLLEFACDIIGEDPDELIENFESLS